MNIELDQSNLQLVPIISLPLAISLNNFSVQRKVTNMKTLLYLFRKLIMPFHLYIWMEEFLFLDSLFSLFLKAKPLILFAINLFMILLPIIWEFHIIHPYHTHFPVFPGLNIIYLFILFYSYVHPISY